MGVAHVVLSLDPGGTESLVINLAKRCAERLPTHIYCLDRTGDWASRLANTSVSVNVIGRRPGRDFRVAQRLRRLIKRDKVAILHCHQYSPFVYGSLAVLPPSRTCVLYTEHGRASDAPPSRVRKIVNGVLGAIPYTITAVSDELRQFMLAEGFGARPISVVYNGIEPGPRPDPAARAAARDALGLPAGLFVIATAARLDRVKNLGMALEAVAALEDRANVRLALIGDGPERDELRSRAACLGIEGVVMWLGYRHDVRSILPAFDAYLNTSVSEGVSITILEAMAAGLPVIATAVGGTPEVVVPDRTGLLVSSNDTAACAAALKYIRSMPDVAKAFGDAARLRLESEFTFQRMLDAYLGLYCDGARHRS